MCSRCYNRSTYGIFSSARLVRIVDWISFNIDGLPNVRVIAEGLSAYFTPHIVIDGKPDTGFHNFKNPYKVSIRQHTGSKSYWIGTHATIWSEAADKGVEHLVQYASAIIAAPGRKLAKIAKHFRGIDQMDQNLDIKEIVLDKRLSFEEKVELLKLKIDYALKNLKGTKRKQFILLLIATLTFFYGNNIVGFTWLWERIRGFIGRGDDTEAIKDLIITVFIVSIMHLYLREY